MGGKSLYSVSIDIFVLFCVTALVALELFVDHLELMEIHLSLPLQCWGPKV